MSKVKGNLGNDFCPQSLFLYGTKKDDGTPDFGLFCWFSYATIEVNKELRMGVMACIGEEKLKDKSLPFMERLKLAAPVITAGETTYTSIDGRELGRWSQPMKTLESKAWNIIR